MKILQINKLYYPYVGGVETVVRQLAEGFAKNKISSHVFAIHRTRDTRQDSHSIIKGVSVVKAKQNFRYGTQTVSFNLIKLLQNFEADIVHLHLPNPYAVLAYLYAQPKGKLVITYHSDIVRQKLFKTLYKPFSEIILEKADRLVATSENLIASSSVLQKHPLKTEVIPLGINPDEYKIESSVLEETKKKFGQGFLLAVGRLVEYKGFKYLIKAMEFVPGQRLYIIGEGRMENKLRNLIKEKRLCDRISLLKSLSFETFKAMMSLSKLFVFPSVSNNEAFGIVQLEAMIFGKPVISSDLPTGVTYVNQDGVTGLIARKKDPIDIARAINTLLSNKELYLSMSENNREYILNNFSEDLMVKKYIQLFDELIHN
ncbi:MAG: glycosyltransferase [Desulfobacteraceae bacterium]|nr:glycosyltransferase [Desulfobacteraceae bacterium]